MPRASTSTSAVRRPSRRRARRANVTTRQVAIGAAVTVGVLAAGWGIYEALKPDVPKRRFPTRPIPEPIPLPPLQGGGAPPGGVGAPCGDPQIFPGFVWNGTACMPSVATPPGIYVVDSCQDFVFVEGDQGTQPDALSQMIQEAIDLSLEPEAKSADPTAVVTAFLDEFWPQCPWPPPPGGSARIVQLFMALSFAVGRYIVLGGGRAVGTSSQARIDEEVAERLAELGYFDFRPDLVPEIELPELDEPLGPPAPPDDGGPDIQDPQPPGPGLIDLDGGGVTPPSQQDGADEPEPEEPLCQKIATVASRTFDLPLVKWTERHVEAIKIFRPQSAECDEYQVAFGLCIGGSVSFGLLDQYVGPNPPADAGEVFFKIRNAGEPPIEYEQWQTFRKPIWWKAQWKTKIRFINGKVSLVNPGTPSTLDLPEMDACPTKTARWPKSPSFFYRVVGDDGDERTWDPMPRLKRLNAVGDTLFAEIEYSGVPVFARTGNDAVAMLAFTTKYTAHLKVWAAGTSPA